MGRHFILIAFILFINSISIISATAATIEEAMLHYNNGEFEDAYENFAELAALGNLKAQYNIGVMYARGEHVKFNLVESLAWFELARNNGSEENTEKVMAIIKPKLSQDEISLANVRLLKLSEKYSNFAIRENLLPSTNLNETQGFISAKQTLKNRAEYPKSMLKLGASGVVDLEFLIERDGSVRYPTVLASSGKAFSKTALEAILKNQYIPASLNGKPVYEYGRKMRVVFQIEGAEMDAKRVNELVDPLKKSAAEGGGLEKYQYAYTLEMINTMGRKFKKGDELNLEEANIWFSKSAQDGFSPAKYELGKRLAYGQYCGVDTKKALFWLEQAAKQKLPEAELMLGMEYLSGARTQQNIPDGKSMIKEAADKGYDHAMLRYTWILATSEDISNEELKAATKYFSEIKEKDYTDKLSYYETEAALNAKLGDFKAADKAYKKGIKVLKKLNLSSDRLANIKKSIDGSQAYVEIL